MSKKGQVDLTSYMTQYIYIYIYICHKYDLLDCHEITKFIYFQTRLPMVIKPSTFLAYNKVLIIQPQHHMVKNIDIQINDFFF
jgi:hypothetical protein